MIDYIAKTLAETRKLTEDVDGLHNLPESLFGSLQTKLIKHVSQLRVQVLPDAFKPLIR